MGRNVSEGETADRFRKYLWHRQWPDDHKRQDSAHELVAPPWKTL